MNALTLARWQFAVTTLYHFLFVPLTIGLSLVSPSSPCCGRLLLPGRLRLRRRATLAGHDLRAYAGEDVRRVIGLATQDAHLFNTNIRENLRLARPEADDGELAAAAASARVLDWIHSLPDGWDTMVGEFGVRVSGGQRQRLALARALLADFPVLVLDEPTANLDAATERAVMDDLLAATEGRSVMLITHRLTGLDRFDEILVLDHGRVVERGGHTELVARQGRYHRMWARAAASPANGGPGRSSG